jgi:putative serine protease PepD
MFLLLIVALFATAFSQPIVTTIPSERFIAVQEITCPVGKHGMSQGTAVVVGDGVIMTDAHVVEHRSGACGFNGDETTVVYEDPVQDIAFVEADTTDITPMTISCEGIKAGKSYVAIGFPGFLNNKSEIKIVLPHSDFPNFIFTIETEDNPQPVKIAEVLSGTGEYRDFKEGPDHHFPSPHLAIMRGSLYQGMSGGPIINEAGEIVGLNTSIYGVDLANRDLKDTPLCR